MTTVDHPVSPTTTMDEGVVVSALRGPIVDAGKPAFGERVGVVDVAFGRRHTATREATGRVPGLEESPLRRAEPATRDPGVDHVPVVIDDGESPLPVGVALGHATGDVGGDRADARDLAGKVVETGESGKVDAELDRAAT